MPPSLKENIPVFINVGHRCKGIGTP